ncbi:uncharacterized protein [Miscanthus floridulus]|uniref:uncharacterized protein n=1 Tax=Miscanthus floridulus TaxID=154761 RepID=UPI003458A2EF
MGAMPPPPPPPLHRMRDTVRKLLCPRSSQKRQAEAPTLAPRKALKAAIQRGTASARADPKEPVAQEEATEAATKQAGEEAPKPHEAEARESDEAEAPSVAEATEGEVEAPRTSKATVVDARAPGTTEAEVAEAGLGAAKPVAQDAEMKAGQASVPPLVQDPPSSQESAQDVELRQQKDLLTGANELLSARSAEVEDLHLRCADMKAEATMAQEQATPLVERIKELEEELTQVAGEWDTFRS